MSFFYNSNLNIGGTTVTTTGTELNTIDGDTSVEATTLADADGVVVNDSGTMKQVALTDFETYFETALDTLSNVTTVGALDSGSITSNFGTINNGSSAITTTGTITFGNLSDGSITITGFVDEDTMTSDSATLIPTQQSVKAYVDANSGGGGSSNASTITVAATTNTTCSVALFESSTGDLAIKSDTGITYDATSNKLTLSGEIQSSNIYSINNSTPSGLAGTGSVAKSYVNILGGEYVTSIIVDLTGMKVNSDFSHKTIIAKDSETTNTSILQITDSNNGLIHNGELFCIEAPSGSGGMGANLGFGFSVTADLDQGGDIEEGTFATNKYGVLFGDSFFSNTYGSTTTQSQNSWTFANSTSTTLSNKYIYIVAATSNSQHTFTTGKFLIKLYGTNF